MKRLITHNYIGLWGKNGHVYFVNKRKEREYSGPGVDMVDCTIVSNYLLLSLFRLFFFMTLILSWIL